LNDSGFAEPLIAILGSEALLKLKENDKNMGNWLNDVINQVSGKTIIPLRQEWISRAHTRRSGEEAMKIIASRGGH
jgi:hypothetical protein